MKKLLVIDDDPAILKSLKDLLVLADYRVKTVSDSINAVKTVEKFLPDLIICDVVMPVLDGIGVLLELSKNSITMNIPFIFLTAKSDLSDIRKGMELGADDYLIKPFTSGDLLRAIEIRLNKRNKILQEMQKTENIIPSRKKLTKDSFTILMTSEKPEQIKIGSIVYIEAMGKYTRLVVSEGKKITVRKLIKEWEMILPEDLFIRIHRSVIINLESVLRIEKWFNNSFRIYMKNVEEPFEASRRYAVKLKSMADF
jgi:DNA-binding LytR/AlgR family response regulator